MLKGNNIKVFLIILLLAGCSEVSHTTPMLQSQLDSAVERCSDSHHCKLTAINRFNARLVDLKDDGTITSNAYKYLLSYTEAMVSRADYENVESLAKIHSKEVSGEDVYKYWLSIRANICNDKNEGYCEKLNASISELADVKEQ